MLLCLLKGGLPDTSDMMSVMIPYTKGTPFMFWKLRNVINLHRRCTHKRVMRKGILRFGSDGLSGVVLHTQGSALHTPYIDKCDDIDTGGLQPKGS